MSSGVHVFMCSQEKKSTHFANGNLPSLRTTSGWLGLGACFVSILWTCGSEEWKRWNNKQLVMHNSDFNVLMGSFCCHLKLTRFVSRLVACFWLSGNSQWAQRFRFGIVGVSVLNLRIYIIFYEIQIRSFSNTHNHHVVFVRQFSYNR